MILFMEFFWKPGVRLVTFSLSSRSHRMTCMAALTSVPSAGSPSLPCTHGGAGRGPPLCSPLTALVIPSCLRTFRCTCALMTCKSVFLPQHLSSECQICWCLISIFKQKVSKTELPCSSPSSAPPSPS